MAKRRAFYVLSSHWDREWYQSFQDYRYRLVRMMDHVLSGLESGKLKGPFYTDGQAILLEDYLEIRPDRRPRIEELVRTGRLSVGPWYVMPDEFLVSGESLIRNLRMGREVARSFGGKPSDAGYICDIFGHNSQLPQIFSGFGIRGAFLWRGINELDQRLVRWRGADGTELMTYVYGPTGYSDFAEKVRHVFDRTGVFDRARTETDFDKYMKGEVTKTPIDPILVFDGGDHQGWDEEVYKVVVEKMALGEGEFQIVHGSLDDYLAEALKQIDRVEKMVSGELREPGRFAAHNDGRWVIPGVLSSRVWIKQENAECQSLLCQWAEPLSAFAAQVLDVEYPKGFIDTAWKWLIQNHPHDSMCGCCIDQVHEDVRYRFRQSRNIAERMTIEAAKRLAANVEGQIKENELRLVLFNPQAKPLHQTTELVVKVPLDWPAFNEFFGFEEKPAFRIYDAQGNEIPYQRLSQARNQVKSRERYVKFPEVYRTNDVKVSLPVDIPAMGYTTLTIRPAEPFIDLDATRIAREPTRHPETPGLATSEGSMANEFLDVTIEANGTLTLTDKRTGRTYSRLLTFEDTADIGDGWYHGVAVNDERYVSTACRGDLALVHNGPMLTTFRVRTVMTVPEEFCFDDTMRRSESRTDLVIDSRVSLRPGADRVEVETTVHNTAKDHRLRVLLPSGAKAGTYLADSPFDVVERPIALRKDNHLYRELEVDTKPQETWTAVFDRQRGLAVVSAGLLETAVQDTPERPIALTLFRGTRRTVMTNGEPGGQLLGSLKFQYWIVPLAGRPNVADLGALGQRLAGGIRSAQLQPADIALYRTGGKLPAQTSFLEIKGDAILTSLRQVERGMEVRMFNPMEQTITISLVIPDGGYTRVVSVNLESRPIGPELAISGGSLTLSIEPKRIVTLFLTSMKK
jgi:alpha-mannosidase